MHVKTTSGSGAAGLGIIGTGLALALPDAKWIGWTLVAAGIFVFIFDIRIERGHIAVGSSKSARERLKRMWPQYLMVLSGILFLVGLVGFLQLSVTPRNQKENAESSVLEYNQPPVVAAVPITPGILLDIAFEVLPRISPPDGTIHIFEIRQEQAGIQTLPIEYQFDPSAIIDWRRSFPDWPIFGISKCEITSTTNESVFYAVIPINLKFREMIPDSPGLPPVEIGGAVQTVSGGIQMRSGRVMMTQQSSFKVGRIYPQTPYVVYFVNRTKYLVDIEVPQEGKVQDFSKTGADFEQKLNMKLGRTTGLHLSASSSAFKSPPAPLPPVLAPPDTPEKR